MSFLDFLKPRKETARTKKTTKTVKSLTPELVRQMFIKGSKQLNEHENYLNRINVFPVPDGDTGSNMSYTVIAVSEALEHARIENFADLKKVIVRTAALNSRGNSGTIISQFFKGFCENFKTLEQIDSKTFVKMLKNGNTEAWNSFDEPQKGTVLDVIEGLYDGSKKKARTTENIIEILDKGLEEAGEALEKTRKIKPEMRKANVVDSGAAGFFYFITGFSAAIQETEIITGEASNDGKIGIIQETSGGFEFCTECVISEARIEGKVLKERVKNLGDSLQIMTVDDLIKIHIHTNEPYTIKDICQKYGKVEGFKVDDLLKEQRENLQERRESSNEKTKSKPKSRARVAIVTDTSADVPDGYFGNENTHIEFIPFDVYLSEGSKENIANKYSSEEFYEKMKTEPNFTPKTSQPTAEAFHQAFEKLLKIYERVICLNISSGISGTYQAALRGKELTKDSSRITTVDTRTTSSGLTIMIEEIVNGLEKQKNIDQIIDEIYDLREQLKIYFIVDNVKYLERGGRLSKTRSIIGQILKIQPLLTLKKGKLIPEKEKIVFGNKKKKFDLLIKKLKKSHPKERPQKLFVIYSGKQGKNEAALLHKRIVEELGMPKDRVYETELNLIVGAHTGPGALGLIYL